MSNAAATSPPDDLLRVREPVVFEPGRRSPRGSSINAPALFSQNAPHSVYDSLNAAAYSYRLGLNILTIIIVGNVLLLICLLEYFYTDEIENFMKQYREHPTALILFFLAIYVVGCPLLVPPNGILYLVTFSFEQVWGTWRGIIYTIIFNFFAQHIAHLVTFYIGRYAFRDMICTKMIRYKKFFVLNRAIRQNGTYINFIARISFLCPHPILTYALSVTDIKLWQFINGNHSILPLSFLFVYIATQVRDLGEAMKEKGSFWEKLEVYYFAVTVVLVIVMIRIIWGAVAKEVSRLEEDFDAAHPNGFDIKKAQHAELRRMEMEKQAAADGGPR